MSKILHIESVVKMPLMDLPVRSTFVQIGDRGLLISPGSKLTVDQLKALPTVTDIIAPNLLHTGGIANAKNIFPNAKIWGPLDAREKKTDINWNYILTKDEWPFSSELEIQPVQGMPKINEVVFFHKPSKSLIVADLVFNLIDAKGPGSFIILSMFGTYKKFAISRFFLRYMADQKLFKDSAANILRYDFSTVAMSHGNILADNAKSQLSNAFAERGINI